MELAKWFAVSGLVLDMVGVSLLFFFDPGQIEDPRGVIEAEDGNLEPDGRTVGEHRLDRRMKIMRGKGLAKWGLALILLGFALQGVGVVI